MRGGGTEQNVVDFLFRKGEGRVWLVGNMFIVYELGDLFRL